MQARWLGLGLRVSVYSLSVDGVRSPILNDSDYVYMQVHRYGRDQIWVMNIHIGWCYAAKRLSVVKIMLPAAAQCSHSA